MRQAQAKVQTFLIAVLALVGFSALANTAIPAPPKLAAKAYVLMDYNSGQVLVNHNGDERLEPASLTKMMTAYIAAREIKNGNISEQDNVRISEKAWRTGGSRMFVEVGDFVSVDNLMKGIVIQSGNDSSVALAEHIAGTESAFADLMNSAAKELGMEHTHFVNSTGLPHPDHYSTAYDMSILGQALIRDYPEHYELYAQKEFTYQGIKQINRNKLLFRDESVDGIKTGYTENAGYCLVTSAIKDDMRLITTVMGSASTKTRARQSQALLTYGSRFFETHALYKGGEALNQSRVWMGKENQVKLGVLEDLYITIPRGRYQALQASMEVNHYIEAPLSVGQPFGKLHIELDENPVLTTELVVLNEVAEGGFIGQLVDKIMLFFFQTLGLSLS